MSKHRHWLVTGASGLLGSVFVPRLAARGDTVTAIENRHNLDFGASARVIQGDLTDLEWAGRVVRDHAPDAVIHCAGLTDVDGCEKRPDYARLIHVETSGCLARAAREAGAQFIHISTDHLWRGNKSFVAEIEPVAPLNVYGRTKAEAEIVVARENPQSLIVRTNFFCRGLDWRGSFTDWAQQKLAQRSPFTAFTDVHFTPVEAGLLTELLIEAAEESADGTLHLCGSERLSKYDFVRRLARCLAIDNAAVSPGSVDEAKLAAPRPKDMSLSTERAARLLGRPMPTVEQSLSRLLADRSQFA